jgi:hypothetical protein
MRTLDKFPDAKGLFELEARGKGGIVVARRKANLIVNGARELMADYFAGIFSETVQEIALGDGGAPGGTPVPPTLTDTALVSEIVGGRKAIASITRPTQFRTQYEVTYGVGEANTTLNEAGLFAGAGSPATTMVARVTFAPIVKTAALTLTVTWKITW